MRLFVQPKSQNTVRSLSAVDGDSLFQAFDRWPNPAKRRPPQVAAWSAAHIENSKRLTSDQS